MGLLEKTEGAEVEVVHRSVGVMANGEAEKIREGKREGLGML